MCRTPGRLGTRPSKRRSLPLAPRGHTCTRKALPGPRPGGAVVVTVIRLGRVAHASFFPSRAIGPLHRAESPIKSRLPSSSGVDVGLPQTRLRALKPAPGAASGSHVELENEPARDRSVRDEKCDQAYDDKGHAGMKGGQVHAQLPVPYILGGRSARVEGAREHDSRLASSRRIRRSWRLPWG
jgi:hypothetical protein